MESFLAKRLLWKKKRESAAVTTLAGPQLYFRIGATVLLLSVGWRDARAEAFLINDAISQAVLTNPGVGEASANRRATETRLYQAQGAYLPQVRLESSYGPEKFNQALVPAPIGNGEWLNGKTASVVVRQILFDGFTISPA